MTIASNPAAPGLDVGARRRLGVGVAAHVLGQRAAAACALRHHHLDAEPGEQADGGLVDGGGDHLLGAAGQQGHTGAARAQRGMDAWPFHRKGRQGRRQQREHRAQATGERARGRDDAAQQRAHRAAGEQAGAQQTRARQHGGQHGAQQAFMPRAAVGLLDVGSRVIDQVHVIHAGRTGGHAGQAGEAAIDVPHHRLGGRAAGFEHVLDQVNAATRAVELVAKQQEGRAGGGAEAAMHAGTQHLVGCGDVGIAQLLRGESGLHRSVPSCPALVSLAFARPFCSRRSLPQRDRPDEREDRDGQQHPGQPHDPHFDDRQDEREEHEGGDGDHQQGRPAQ
jgi:hypothetical protein